MTDEEWDAYVRTHDSKAGISEARRVLAKEAKMLHTAWEMDKFSRPAGRERRRSLGQGLRELRMARYADLHARAILLDDPPLAKEIHTGMLEEVRS
jgi:hypothetical protein